MEKIGEKSPLSASLCLHHRQMIRQGIRRILVISGDSRLCQQQALVLAQCMAILAKFACAEYGGSAASTYLCSCCAGSEFIDDQADNKNRPKTSLNSPCNNPPRNPLACYIDNREREKRLCKSCDGKGTVSNRCRCNGTGKVLDRKETKIHGYLVIKICKRCAGRGYKRVPASITYAAISILLPKLTQSTWSRNWKPFYESLILQCKIEENKAKAVFKQITG